MPASVRRVQRGRKPGSRLPVQGDRPESSADILGEPPAEILDEFMFTPARQRRGFKRFPGTDELNPGALRKPERLQSIGFAFGDLPREIGQRRPPSSPFGIPREPVIPVGPLTGVTAPTLRRLMTLPPKFQAQVIDAVEGIDPRRINAEIERSIDQGLFLSQTPGEATTEELRAALELPQEFLKGIPVTTDELDDARARLTGAAGPDAPEPTEDELFTEVIEARQEEQIDSGIFFPPSASVPFTPAEDFQAAEQQGE